MPRVLVIHGAGMNMRGKVQIDDGFDAAIFNPAAFGSGYPALVAAISHVKFPAGYP